MDEVINLSSESDDWEPINEFGKTNIQKIDDCKTELTKMSRFPFSISDDEYDLPEVPFSSITAAKQYSGTVPLSSGSITKSNGNIEENLLNKYLVNKLVSVPITEAKKKNSACKVDELSTNEKDLLKIQRIKNAKDAGNKKAEKLANAERLKSMKPGECMKYIKVAVDLEFQDFSFFEDLVTELRNFQLTYSLKSQRVPNSITWTRTVKETGSVISHSIEENHVIMVWDYRNTLEHIENNTFIASIMNIKDLTPKKVLTLIIYGMEKYFKHHKNLKSRTIRTNAGLHTKGRSGKEFEGLPVITRKKLELSLIEIKLRFACSSQLIESSQDLASVIHRYTKAIAEAPYKLEKQQVLQENELGWYSVAENRDTVRVDKEGNGLKRLWQQQLCQFNMAKLETAEAIISQYPSPLHLMEAYANCTPSEGKKLLEHIAIRRTAGPLTAIRKIGPELSKKVYVMFTSEDGEAVLDDEQT